MAYMPHTAEQVKVMLEVLEIDSPEELFRDIPPGIRLNRPLNLPSGLAEKAAWERVIELAERNVHTGQYISFLGAGAYEHYQPKAVNHILFRSEFYTAYTPYQPEISQGTLQAIFEFQTMICELTGMDAANASVYDGATSAAEGALMTVEAARRGTVLVSSLLHPEYQAAVQTYLHGRGIKTRVLSNTEGVTSLKDLKENLDQDTAGVIIQNPNFLGSIEDLQSFAQVCHEGGALLEACVDPVSLGLLESPGILGADIVVGEGQGLGLPVSFGGPYLGFMATREKHIRRLPGRMVGKTVDRLGREGYVLTLQAREQHIRREKASSNICSNQALCALAATIYLSLLGPVGLAEVGRQCLQKSYYARTLLSRLPGVSIPFQAPTFKEFVVKTLEEPAQINKRLLKAGIFGGLDLGVYYPELKNHILLCITEMRTREEIEKLAVVWGEG